MEIEVGSKLSTSDFFNASINHVIAGDSDHFTDLDSISLASTQAAKEISLVFCVHLLRAF